WHVVLYKSRRRGYGFAFASLEVGLMADELIDLEELTSGKCGASRRAFCMGAAAAGAGLIVLGGCGPMDPRIETGGIDNQPFLPASGNTPPDMGRPPSLTNGSSGGGGGTNGSGTTSSGNGSTTGTTSGATTGGSTNSSTTGTTSGGGTTSGTTGSMP